jgi:hypothetical protein
MKRRTQLTLALVACLLAGCGFGGDDEVTERVQQPSLLTREDLESLPEGGAARTVFEWWRTLQFDNPLRAVDFYSEELGVTAERLERQMRWGAGALGLTQKPRLVEVQKRGDTAAVLVLLESVVTNPNGRVDKTRTARSFNVLREDGEWKLAENMYLERQAGTQQRFADALSAQQQNGQDAPSVPAEPQP